MLYRRRISRSDPRRGVAATELAVLLPFFAWVFLAGVDYARLFYAYVTVTDCARNGALYAMLDSTHAQNTAGIQAAALADATNLNQQPTVSSSTGADSYGNMYVAVTVKYAFQTLITYPGIPSTTTVSRTVQMEVISP